MTIKLRKAAAGLAALAVSTAAGATPAVASNTGTPPGPPQYAGSPASVANGFFVSGAFVTPCKSNGGGAGNTVTNGPRGYNPNNPHGSC
jgi:hypothetical protein